MVNNAGFSAKKPAWEIEENDWNRIVDTGLKGVFFCSQIVGTIMRSRNYGKIINLSSTFSRSFVVGQSVYATVKAGVSHLTPIFAEL